MLSTHVQVRLKKLRANDDLHHKIKCLPKITFDEINAAINFKSHWGAELTHYTTYGLEIKDEYALVEVGEGATYTPLPDMIEITVSEYNKLKGK